MKLPHRRELVGFLKDIKKENGEIILIFDMQKEIELPSSDDFNEKLAKFTGKKIGLLSLNGKYYFRLIEED